MVDDVITRIAALRAARATRTADFDPVTLLVRRELDQSRIFAWMLNPHGTHGQGTLYLDGFLERIGRPAAGTRDVTVETERTIRQGGEGGRIDVLVRHREWTIAIENKPWCRFGDQQVERYVAAIRSEHRTWQVVVLLGRGWEAGVRDRLSATEGVTCLMLGDEVVEWLADCMAATPRSPVRDFVEGVHRYLEKTFGADEGADVRQDIKVMLASPGSVAATIGIIDAEGKFVEAMNRRFLATVSGHAAIKGLEISPVAGDKPLFGYDKWGMLRIDVGDAAVDFAIVADRARFQEVAFGLVLKPTASRLARDRKALAARLRTVLGDSEPEHETWPWWQWIKELDTSALHTVDRASSWAWAADESGAGLAATLVNRASEVKAALAG